MLRVKFIIISSIFIFLSCAKRAPEGILPEKKMTELMAEVAMIDGYLNTLIIDSAKRVMPVLYGQAFKKFDIDSATFEHNVRYYLGNPPLAEKVYAAVTTKLQSLERTYYREDSIRNVFVQDSVARVYRIQANALRMRNALLYVRQDSLPYNYFDNSIFFKELVPIKINPIELKRRQEILGQDSVKKDSKVLTDSAAAAVDTSMLEKPDQVPTPVEKVVPHQQLQREAPQRLRNSSKPRKLEVLEASPSH